MSPMDEQEIRILVAQISTKLEYLSIGQTQVANKIDRQTAELKETLREYVRIETFTPVRNVVYGLVTLVMSGFIVWVIAQWTRGAM